MKAHKYTFILVVIFIAAGSVQAAGDWDIYSDAVIADGDDYWTVRIFDTPPDHTTVDMTGGSANGIQSYDASILNISGGSAEVTALEQSIVNISGGHVQTLAALNISTVNVSDGTLYSLSAYDNSIINYSDSASTFTIISRDNGAINMYGGTTERLGSVEYGTINIYGGSITGALGVSSFSVVNVYGYNLVKTSTGGFYDDGQVYGYWFDSSAFIIDLSGPDTYSTINLIPEPSSLMILVVGSFIIKRKR